jgi:hypothetical protein
MKMLCRRGSLFVAAGMLALTLGSCKKSSESSSGGSASFTSYAGTYTITGGTGSCPTSGSGTASVAIASDGTFTFTSGTISGSGSINLTSGAYSGTITDAMCGNGTSSGTCMSFSSCSGTFDQGTFASQAAGSGGSTRGTATLTR